MPLVVPGIASEVDTEDIEPQEPSEAAGIPECDEVQDARDPEPELVTVPADDRPPAGYPQPPPKPGEPISLSRRRRTA
jgi:hypothetical protein